MADYTLPDRVRLGLELLAKLTDAEVDGIASALESAEPSLGKKPFAERIAKTLPQLSAKVSPVLDGILSVASLRAYVDGSSAEFLDDVLDESSEKPDRLNLPQEGFNALRKRLTRLLSLKSIVTTGKAYGVMTAHQHVFGSARIFSDIRPIFGDSEDEFAPLPVATVFVHTLRIGYTTTGGWKDFYVAMDDSDIKKLIKTLERAVAKSAQLKESVERMGYPNLPPEE
jgi:hypothetical protein